MTRRILAGLAMLLLLGSMTTTPVSASAVAPPPIPTGVDGKKLPGQWVGPFTYRNQHSGNCMDLSFAGTGASVVQNSCIAGKTTQAWYRWEYMGDGFISFALFGKQRQRRVRDRRLRPAGRVDAGLLRDRPPDLLPHFGPAHRVRHQWSGLCLEVGGWSKDDGATIMTWDCLHNPDQVWFRYDWH